MALNSNDLKLFQLVSRHPDGSCTRERGLFCTRTEALWKWSLKYPERIFRGLEELPPTVLRGKVTLNGGRKEVVAAILYQSYSKGGSSEYSVYLWDVHGVTLMSTQYKYDDFETAMEAGEKLVKHFGGA